MVSGAKKREGGGAGQGRSVWGLSYLTASYPTTGDRPECVWYSAAGDSNQTLLLVTVTQGLYQEAKGQTAV